MAIYHHTTRMIGRSNGGNPVRALSYISGVSLADQKTGEFWDFKDKSVQEVQILLPENAPSWAKEIQRLVLEDREKGLQVLSDMVNAAEKRVDGQVYREIEFSLPRELTYEQNKKLAREYVQDQFCSLGMLAIQSFHIERNEATGELNPHCHTFFLTRELTGEGLSVMKNRDWNQRELHASWREQWAQYASFHLKMHGYDITLDHRSYKEQGIDIEPQVKLGKGVKEQEKRARKGILQKDGDQERMEGSTARQALEKGLRDGDGLDHSLVGSEGYVKAPRFIETRPKTDRAQEFRDVQLRNLYRIMRRPEIVFDIVTRHHATFMWGDVQKVLGRYVDEADLFQRLDVRLQNSKELLLLKMEEVRNKEGQIEGQAIYTTRNLLKTEKALVGAATSLAESNSHAVSLSSVELGLGRMQEKLKKEGFDLSEGQEKAILHLVDEGQLKCIVGYAGAGKTTALEACRDIWETEGYSVYGLAPTGRASQNLEGSGISSQTLHKFLKSFDEGRCQYNSKSVLVLDEAGMVDVGRFERFLGAVKELGVKAVVVGDAAQLQPVEAGPAFRLVTTRVETSRLEEIVRQKVDWQKEATILFGKQETQKAIQAYHERGHVHIVDERLPGNDQPQDVVTRYEMSARTSGLIFREIVKDVQGLEKSHDEGSFYERAKDHEDYNHFLKWREIQKEAGKKILGNSDVYRPYLEERHLDPLEMARLFVDKGKSKEGQYNEARDLLKAKKLDHLIGVERSPGQTVEVRSGAKALLIADWQKAYKEHPEKVILMMAYSNRDVRDLNDQARDFLKASGKIETKDHTYVITREVEGDFGRKINFKEERSFSKGDKIVFTRNNYGLGVKNGSMGMITHLDSQKVQVTLDKGEKISFAPNLNPYFDNGWAVTIHKTQGINGDKTLLLASHEMNQNLTYVGMTRHREDVQVYGSSCDFWREEKVAEILSKSGEKLGAADYLDAVSLSHLMKEEDKFLEKLFTKLSDELQAMGAVSKRVFKSVADHFLGRESSIERPILLKTEIIREEDRAHGLLQKETTKDINTTNLPEYYGSSHEVYSGLRESVTQKNDFGEFLSVQDIYEDMKHPAFSKANHYKRVFEEGRKLYGDNKAIRYWQEKREPFIKIYEDKLARVEEELKSPLLDYLSDKSRDLTRKAALEDPDKALSFLNNLQASKQAEQEERIAQSNKNTLKDRNIPIQTYHNVSPSLEDKQRQEFKEAFSSYFRFKELKHDFERSSHDADLRKEMREIGKAIFKNKEAFEQIKSIDPDIAKEIQRNAQEKKISLEHDLGRDRGGLSL